MKNEEINIVDDIDNSSMDDYEFEIEDCKYDYINDEESGDK